MMHEATGGEAAEAVRDAQWIEGIRRGDEAAFAAMVRTYYTGLFDFAYSYTRSPEAAEDLVQDVLLNVWEDRHRWQPRSTAKAYLFRAVRNRALNYLRDSKRRRADDLSAAEGRAQTDQDPEDDLQYQTLVADYRAAVEELPARRRLIFRLSRLYGLTYDETAAVLGLSVNTVRTQMTAALKHLRTRLARHLE